MTSLRLISGLLARFSGWKRTVVPMVAAAMVLTACDPGAISSSPGGRPGAVTVALLVPAGASDVQVAAIADSFTQAAQLAVEDHGGGLVTVRAYPTAGEENQSVAVAQQAMADGADVILGPLYAQNAAAVGRVVAANGKSVLAFSNNTDVAGGNVFLLGNTFENTAAQLGQYAARNGKGRVMVINADQPAERFGMQAIVRGMAGTGSQVVGTGDFEFSQEGLVAAMPDIASTAKAVGANSIFLTSDTQGALREVTNLLPSHGLGPEQVQYIGLTRWDIPRSATSLPGLQGGWFALPDPNAVAAFNAKYATAYGVSPHPLAALAYDGITAIAKQANTSGRAGLTPQALVSAGTFTGATGEFSLQIDGTVRRSLAIASIENNAVVILQGAVRSTVDAGS
ncbi:MAG: penicillin-binding protein activator [Pseudomonadota bacterium]